ncbi:MAG: heat-inducible transcriptional repressor HrcA [Candidatus Dormibacteria bacterium]
MDGRKERILQAVVSDYTETVVPVGSHVLAARYFMELSSATIRNELSELVDDGFLAQPHPSAGRVPTDLGYRYFVDFLLPQEIVEPVLRRQVRQRFMEVEPDVEAILELAAATLSRLSDNVALVTGPAEGSSRLARAQLVSTRPGHALVVVVGSGRRAQQRTVEVDPALDQEALNALTEVLNRVGAGMTAEELEASPMPEVVPRAVVLEVGAGLRQLENRSALVLHDGVRNLVRNPEFEDPNRLRVVLEVLEAQRILAAVVSQLAPQSGVQVVIGHENSLEELQDCSLVLTSYRVGTQLWGTVGVVGPTRIRYARVAARLQLISQVTGEALARVLA